MVWYGMCHFIIAQVISVLYPDLSALVDKLVDMFHSVDADLRYVLCIVCVCGVVCTRVCCLCVCMCMCARVCTFVCMCVRTCVN